MAIEKYYSGFRARELVPVEDIRRVLARKIRFIRQVARGLPRADQIAAGRDLDLLHEFVEDLGLVLGGLKWYRGYLADDWQMAECPVCAADGWPGVMVGKGQPCPLERHHPEEGEKS